MSVRNRLRPSVRVRRRAFSLAELLVVVGIVVLLIAITLPPLQMARAKAMQTTCSGQLQQLGRALESVHTELGCYPLWDDGGGAVRFTWIDVLIQRGLLPPVDTAGRRPRTGAARHVGYCPADTLPDEFNTSRHPELVYPLDHEQAGIDYSYGIGAPLAASGEDGRRRSFPQRQRGASGRVLAGDAYASAIYNLSGDVLTDGTWSRPTQFDNTVAWGRHLTADEHSAQANILFQDGHVSAVRYAIGRLLPVNTSHSYTWYSGEPLHVCPEDSFEGYWYPYCPPTAWDLLAASPGYPNELNPRWYTLQRKWSRIMHK